MLSAIFFLAWVPVRQWVVSFPIPLGRRSKALYQGDGTGGGFGALESGLFDQK